MFAVDFGRLALWLLVSVVIALAVLAIAVGSGYATSKINVSKQRSARAGFWWGFGVPILAIAVAALRRPAAEDGATGTSWTPSRRMLTRIAVGVGAAAIVFPAAGVAIYTQFINNPAPRIDDEDHLFGLVGGDDEAPSTTGLSLRPTGLIGAVHGVALDGARADGIRAVDTEPMDALPPECDDPASSEPPADGESDADSDAARDDDEDGGEFDGDWFVADGSEVGYRVAEELAGVSSEAVGRTPDIAGGITVEGDTVTAACFVADMTTIESDQSLRDGQFHGRIMSTGEHPTAMFVLTEPIDLDELPEVGGDESISASATGDLTMHGVPRSVTFDVTVVAGSPDGERVLVAIGGAIDINFDDYDIPDASGGPARVGRDGELEFALLLEQS